MVRQQVERCWSPPAGAIGADDLQVQLAFSLNRDGSLSGRPSIVNRSGAPYFQAAAESARTAVYQCSPLRLPARDYDYWKEVQITFDPRDMRGG
jgi:colicin import membrane protein